MGVKVCFLDLVLSGMLTSQGQSSQATRLCPERRPYPSMRARVRPGLCRHHLDWRLCRGSFTARARVVVLAIADLLWGLSIGATALASSFAVLYAARVLLGVLSKASHGKASVIWRAIHSAVGWSVTLSEIRRRRSCRRITKTSSSLKLIVGTCGCRKSYPDGQSPSSQVSF
jgi:hypothetical protein